MEKKTFSTELGGETLTAEFTDLAEQAHGSVIMRLGKSAVLVTAVMSDRTRDDIDYFPLTVEYEEKFYAAGQILGSRFTRREGRPSEEAVLSGRIVDRTIRPLFNHAIRNEVQVIVTVLSIDEHDPDVLGVIGASLALSTSDIPWDGPISAVRIGKKETGENTVNPTYLDRKHDEYVFDILACGQNDTINMIEVGAREAQENELTGALASASQELLKIQQFQEQVIKEIGKEKRVVETQELSAEIVSVFTNAIEPKLPSAVISGEAGKKSINALKKEWLLMFREQFPDESKPLAERYFEDRVDETLHREAIENDKRADGRAFDEVRPLFAKAGGVAPMAHGTGVFYRGGTHVFTALTLGGPGESLIVDDIEGQGLEEKKRFMHHYNFPPFSAGETGRVGGFNRRMIGHGALAEKALETVIPSKNDFPYTIRLVSECFASNGSTSMGSVCASTVALMDGGVPITRPVAGIAMGLMMNKQGAYKVLTDIQGPEDHHGDMDFKVAGTREGVTAVQMDVKVSGVPLKILFEALTEARKARLHILETIEKEIAVPRADIAPHAPKILTLKIKVDKIGLVIGPGGKTINGIREDTGAEDITIEEDGTIYITGKGGSAEKAHTAIEELTHEYTAGERYTGVVTRILDFGAFVKIGKNSEGLVHISEMAPFRIDNVRAVVSEGEEIPVIVKEVDEQGRLNLSLKGADPEFAKRKGIAPSSTPPSHNNRAR
jgi:polyribonucleotide nucleotidyltransferase